ncbi:hypothetical protein ACR79T_10140 [Sphingobacterium spiritivorum]|uniref:hypothetical protein n=1 Tax=Sphingobacterium spiritivorum TaxID=258 RepID=UPI003DA5186A
MKNILINAISYTTIGNITKYTRTATNKIDVQSDKWVSLPVVVASGEITISTKKTPAGRIYMSNLSCRLNQEVRIPDQVVLLIGLCDYSALVLGTPDLPVDVNQAETMYLSSLNITHEGINPVDYLQELT